MSAESYPSEMLCELDWAIRQRHDEDKGVVWDFGRKKPDVKIWELNPLRYDYSSNLLNWHPRLGEVALRALLVDKDVIIGGPRLYMAVQRKSGALYAVRMRQAETLNGIAIEAGMPGFHLLNSDLKRLTFDF